MQHYALYGWHDEAAEEAYRVLGVNPSAVKAQTYLEDLSEARLYSGSESQTMKGKGKAKAKGKVKVTTVKS